jgi:hypothetical protein
MNNKIILFPSAKQPSSIKKQRVPVTVRTLALALRVNLNISSDASLVYILSNGKEKNNQKAIETWLSDNYSENEIKAMSSPLKEISNSLERYITNKLMMEKGAC